MKHHFIAGLLAAATLCGAGAVRSEMDRLGKVIRAAGIALEP